MAGLYSKREYEIDLLVIDRARHIVRTQQVEGEIDAFESKRLLDRLDDEELRCRGRLAGTRMTLSSRDAERKQEANHNPMYLTVRQDALRRQIALEQKKK